MKTDRSWRFAVSCTIECSCTRRTRRETQSVNPTERRKGESLATRFAIALLVGVVRIAVGKFVEVLSHLRLP